MKKIQHYLVAGLLLGGLMTMSSCNDDEDEMNMGPEGTGDLVTFPLNGVANSTAEGMVTFELMDDASTKVTVELEGTVDGEMHPMHIHENTAAEGGGIVITL
ncbi:MAG: CHRD domain-containing protein, partial [Cyclobacteriaceae bacterium]